MNLSHTLRVAALAHPRRPALSEDRRTLDFAAFESEVAAIAGSLRNRHGLAPGDRVALWMDNCLEFLPMLYGIWRAGLVAVPVNAKLHPRELAFILDHAAARLVFATADLASSVKAPGLETVICVGDQDYEALFAGPPAPLQPCLPDDTAWLFYTSGTTGRPKGAVHTHCGFPVKAAQDMRHSMDVKPGETFWWFTDMGWMMGPWLVFGSLLNGAAMLFYDGAPDYPGPDRLWAICARHGVTHLGITPSLIRALKPHGDAPVQRHDLAALRAVGSTGSPWDPESWLWTFHTVLGGRKPILNYSGGTEISGGILCGNFFTPMKPCSFSGPVVGMDADVVDDVGHPVRGAVGELVIRQPWIGMTRGFWRDRERYRETYWNRIPGLWVHGDFAAIDADGLWYILGRSDDTIKVAGKRLGPAEVEAILNAHPAVKESAAVGVPHPVKDQEVVAFCVLHDAAAAGDELRRALLERVAAELGKPLRPRTILFVSALPKTRNAKVMHRVIRAAYLGEPLGDLSSLENAGTVEAIRQAV